MERRGGREVFLVFFFFSRRPLPMLHYVTAILNDDGAASSSVVSHFAVALTGKSGFRVHARVAQCRGRELLAR